MKQYRKYVGAQFEHRLVFIQQPVVKHLLCTVCLMLVTWWWARKTHHLPMWSLLCGREAGIKLVIAHL